MGPQAQCNRSGLPFFLLLVRENPPDQVSVETQPASGATYAARLTSEDERLNWERTAHELECQVRALSPRPGAHLMFAGKRWKVLSARAISELVKTKPGYVLDDQLTVSCGNGLLQPTELQRPGRKAMPTAEVLRGAPIPPGTKLE